MAKARTRQWKNKQKDQKAIKKKESRGGGVILHKTSKTAVLVRLTFSPPSQWIICNGHSLKSKQLHGL